MTLLEVEEVVKPSGSDAQTALRLPAAMLKRADALRAKIAKSNPTAVALGGRVSRSAVLKLAIAHGLDELEKQYK